MTRYVLGLDGGGTKTDVLLCTPQGQVIDRFTVAASSVSGQSVEKALAQLRAILQRAFAACSQSGGHIAGYYAGISGAGLAKNQQIFQSFLDDALPGIPGKVGSDAANALAAGIGLQDGCIAIAGTGSCVQYRANNAMKRVGGWGYLLGDEGSGYDLGRRALMLTLQAEDGRISPGKLAALCKEQMQMSADDFTAWLYRQDAKPIIASYAPLLLQAAEEGDPLAIQHVQEATAEMARAIQTAADLARSHLVVLGGSLWKSNFYQACVKQHLPSQLTFVTAQAAPVYGAAVLAAQAISDPTANMLFQRFCNPS